MKNDYKILLFVMINPLIMIVVNSLTGYLVLGAIVGGVISGVQFLVLRKLKP